MLEIFQFDFMIRAFIAGCIIAVIAPVIGTFLVVRRYSVMADTLAHVSLVGVAIGILTSFNPVITATLTSVIVALGIDQLRSSKKIFGESILALFLSASLAVASVLISFAHGFNANLFSYLFGSITTVSQTDLYFMEFLGLIVLTTVFITYKQLFAISLDEELAEAGGIKTKIYNRLIIILAAVTVSLAMRIVGVLLIGALMVIPVITAIQYGSGFKKTLILSVGFSLTAVITGLFGSYYLNLATGGSIVIVALIIFMASLFINRNR